MNRRLLLGLGAVFMVLLMVTLLQGQQINEQINQQIATASDIESIRLFTGVTPENVMEVQIASYDGRALTLQRNGDGTWNSPNLSNIAASAAATPGATASVNTQTADAVLYAALTLTYVRRLEATTETQYASYGFPAAAPTGSVSITLVLRDGTTRQLQIGGLAPTREQYYVRLAGEPGVYLVERSAALGGGQIDYLLNIFFEVLSAGGQ